MLNLVKGEHVRGENVKQTNKWNMDSGPVFLHKHHLFGTGRVMSPSAR